MAATLTLHLPSGFGEILMIWSKLSTAPSLPAYRGLTYKVEICVDDPRGCEELVHLLPHVSSVRRGTHSTTDILTNPVNPDSRLVDLIPGPVRPTVDGFTVAGNPLSRYLPELPTDYHFPLTLPVSTRESAARVVKGDYLLVYPSTLDRLHMKEGWGEVWQPSEWADFARALEDKSGFPVYLIGSRRDSGMLNYVLAASGLPPGRILKPDRLVDALALIAGASYFAGFPSGPSVAAGVLDVPHCTLFRMRVQCLHRGSFTDPDMILSGRAYLPYFSDGPAEVVDGILSRLQHARRFHKQTTAVRYVPDAVLAAPSAETAQLPPVGLEGDLRRLAEPFRTSSLGILAKPVSRDCFDRGIPDDEHYGWLYALGKYFLPRQILEVGVLHGHGVCSLLAAVLDAGVPPTQVGLVDLSSLGYATHVVRMVSARSSWRLDVRTFQGVFSGGKTEVSLGLSGYDLIHLDGSRDPSECLNDLRLAWRLLASSGVLVLCGTRFDGPRAAFEAFCREMKVATTPIPTCCGLGVLRKVLI